MPLNHTIIESNSSNTTFDTWTPWLDPTANYDLGLTIGLPLDGTPAENALRAQQHGPGIVKVLVFDSIGSAAVFEADWAATLGVTSQNSPVLSFGATQITASASGWTVIQGGNDGFLKWPKIAGREYAFTTQWTVAGGTPNTSAAGYLPFKVRLTPTAVPGGAAAKVELETFIAGMNASYYYNQSPMSEWDTQFVTNMDKLFYNMTTFNADISSWNTSNVTSMTQMFKGAASFNHDIGGWDVQSATNMAMMFNDAIAFNYTLELWNVSNVTTFTDIFTGATGLSDANKDIACGEYWSENTNFTSTSFYTDFKNASGCDPYVMTLTGELYKLDNITGVCRMMQGTLQGKPFIINTMMKLDSENKERQMNEWSSKNAGGLETSNLEMQSFYTHVFVKHGDSECIVDLENGTVRGTPETDLVIKPISGKHSEIPMYNREVCSGGCSIRAGPVVVFAKMFPNRQVRSEIATCGGRAVKNADGFAVRPMRTKVCRVKKLTDGGMLTMKRSHYKGEVRERFYSTADKEGKVRTIPRV